MLHLSDIKETIFQMIASQEVEEKKNAKYTNYHDANPYHEK
jgi:hypothetical protein